MEYRWKFLAQWAEGNLTQDTELFIQPIHTEDAEEKNKPSEVIFLIPKGKHKLPSVPQQLLSNMLKKAMQWWKSRDLSMQ